MTEEITTPWIAPKPGEEVTIGKPYRVQWTKGQIFGDNMTATLFVGADTRALTFVDILARLEDTGSDPGGFEWTPASNLQPNNTYSIYVRVNPLRGFLVTRSELFSLVRPGQSSSSSSAVAPPSPTTSRRQTTTTSTKPSSTPEPDGPSSTQDSGSDSPSASSGSDPIGTGGSTDTSPSDLLLTTGTPPGAIGTDAETSSQATAAASGTIDPGSKPTDTPSHHPSNTAAIVGGVLGAFIIIILLIILIYCIRRKRGWFAPKKSFPPQPPPHHETAHVAGGGNAIFYGRVPPAELPAQGYGGRPPAELAAPAAGNVLLPELEGRVAIVENAEYHPKPTETQHVDLPPRRGDTETVGLATAQGNRWETSVPDDYGRVETAVVDKQAERNNETISDRGLIDRVRLG